MPSQTLVRAARAADRDAIIAFCQNTFSWGDYIADVWERWLANGQLLVGVVNDQPISLMHVALHGEMAWLEGMRVHPDFRRQGSARAVEAAGRAWAREHGCRVACLATSIKNVAAQGMLDAIGYHRAAQFNDWEIEPAPGDFSRARIATENDLRNVDARWRASESCAASHAIVPDRQWHWTPLDDARWREHLRAGEVRVAPNGLALLLASEEHAWIGMSLLALAGDEDAMGALAHAARGEAAYRGYPRLEGQVADCPAANRALERAGFTRGGGMFIYEIEL
ncbi:MAG: GNAT family N-acetyltransferase [Chloroflexi bacterium]|nr:GNAT family N-acetyltransferase [Chloroflexota bacterium]